MKIINTKGHNPLKTLFEEPPSIESETEYQKLMIMEEILKLMKQQNISRSELVKRMGVKPSRITAMMDARDKFSIKTLVRAARALGVDLQLTLVPAKKQTSSKASHSS